MEALKPPSPKSVPRLPASRQPGFGTVIVDAMINKQIKGKIDRHWIDTGLMMLITVPGIH
jgi:hypothetical protein